MFWSFGEEGQGDKKFYMGEAIGSDAFVLFSVGLTFIFGLFFIFGVVSNLGSSFWIILFTGLIFRLSFQTLTLGATTDVFCSVITYLSYILNINLIDLLHDISISSTNQRAGNR